MTHARIGMPGEGDARPLEETPFRVALVGDWSGRGARAAGPPIRVDRDDLDAALARLRPEAPVRLEPDGPAIPMRVDSMEDFHPDRLLQRVPLLRTLAELRRRLADPRSFKAAAAALATETSPRAGPGGADLLSSILEQQSPADASAALAESGGDLHGFIQRIMRPHLVPRPDPRQAEVVAQTDQALAAALRAVLRAPAFQALEARWRAAEFLAFHLETSADLQLHLVDLADSELDAALPAGGNPEASPLHRLLAGATEDGPWSLLVSTASFGPDPADVERLAQLAAVGRLLGAPWLAGADPRLVGAASLAATPDPAGWNPAPHPAWDAFRDSGLAASVGLALPRWLLRRPYGADDPLDTFPFDELEPEAGPDALLWGPPGFAVAFLIARGVSERGWSFLRGFDPEISGLPLVVQGKGAAARTLPVAELPLTEAAATRIMDRGIMPLAWLKDQDRVRLVRLQSAARPLAPLAGRWPAG